MARLSMPARRQHRRPAPHLPRGSVASYALLLAYVALFAWGLKDTW